jgi:hypothetical protein
LLQPGARADQGAIGEHLVARDQPRILTLADDLAAAGLGDGHPEPAARLRPPRVSRGRLIQVIAQNPPEGQVAPDLRGPPPLAGAGGQGADQGQLAQHHRVNAGLAGMAIEAGRLPAHDGAPRRRR